jgi:DNA modification methylase
MSRKKNTLELAKTENPFVGYKSTAEARATAGEIPVFCAFDELVSTVSLVGNPRNPNKHPQEQIKLLAAIIGAQGWRSPITVSRRSGYVVRGHGRLAAALTLGAEVVPVDYQNYATEAEEWADLIADNRIAELSALDDLALSELLAEIEQSGDIDTLLTGYNPEQIEELLSGMGESKEETARAAHQSLQEKFLVAPFSILDARAGAWNDRKTAWKNLGLKSEVGRDDQLTFSKSSQPPSVYQAKNDYEKKLGKSISWTEYAELFPSKIAQRGTSIFDPVMCEIAYRWFCPQGGKILDPFAGGSVRGIVAALTGRQYTGIDISERQIEANRANWKDIQATVGDTSRVEHPPDWIIGDSMNVKTLAQGEYDLLFTCPPYADLEVYSDDPADISNKAYPEFIRLYRNILSDACSMLAPDSFACVVVGEVRSKEGGYYNFVGDTIKAFTDAGMSYYNECILITKMGSLAIRAGRQFTISRKIGKTHQNVLVFSKGDSKKATTSIGDMEDYDTMFADLE